MPALHRRDPTHTLQDSRICGEMRDSDRSCISDEWGGLDLPCARNRDSLSVGKTSRCITRDAEVIPSCSVLRCIATVADSLRVNLAVADWL
jgi:hypothetical protein